MRRAMRPQVWASVTLAAALLSACGSGEADVADDATSSPSVSEASPSADYPSALSPSVEAAPPDRRVLVVSLDGFNPEILQRREMPTLERLIDEGASTLNARTAVGRTTTLPNHASMLTGRPVFGPEGHQVDFNTDEGTDLQQLNEEYVASFFDPAHDAGLRTGLYNTKDKFATFDRSWDEDSGAPDTTGEDNGPDKIDTFVVDDEKALVEQVRGDLTQSGLAAGLLHFGAFDQVGHQEGFMSEAYLDQAPVVDALLERLVETIEASPQLSESTTLLITADHGGLGDGHYDTARLADYRIPFVAWGRSVEAGADLYALNPQRVDPGESQPTYDVPQPVRNLDVAATALSLLELPTLPEATDALQLR